MDKPLAKLLALPRGARREPAKRIEQADARHKEVAHRAVAEQVDPNVRLAKAAWHGRTGDATQRARVGHPSRGAARACRPAADVQLVEPRLQPRRRCWDCWDHFRCRAPDSNLDDGAAEARQWAAPVRAVLALLFGTAICES